ncbi:MAG: prepilin-type N-terminal cleavage/methylation domain-containing protein, partial [Clostridia bacterium]|nr:prepilin-type N-terminal cleavage/methylation domain-containing protein [Clostridia bacterium]
MTTHAPNTSKSNRRSRLGFTMMEMLTVLAIMAILFAIAIPMVGDIQKTLELSRLDSYATDIYLAVENRLMAMKASGELLDLQGELYNNYATHSYTLVPEDYADGPYADRWVGGDNGSFRPQDWLDWTTEDNIIYENFFYIVHTPTGRDGGDPIIQTIVPTTTATEAVAGAYYIIEMNPTNGDLYGVFYADKPITFEDVLAMQTRSRDERKGVMIGYYTKGYTDVLTRGEMDAFQIKMSFINKEDLYLHVECDVRTAYFDRHDIVAGVTFHDTRDPEGTQYDLTVPIDLTDPTIWGKSAGSYSTFSVNLLLDSLEEGKTFADIFGSASLTGFRNPFTYPQNKNCSGTFIPGDDIRATMDVHYSKAGRMMLTDTEHAADFPTRLTQNSLFESNDGHGSITVGYVRHLRNLGLYTYEGTEDVSIKQSQDISFTPTYLGSDGVARALWEEDARADGSLENPLDAFEPIYNTTLFAGTKTSTFDGQNNHLIYFTIAKANAGDANVGLFARADGAKLQNIVMINPTVTGGNNTGALVGLAQSTTIINCGAHLDTIDPETDVYYPDMEDRINRYKVASSGETALGGLVGKATGATKLIGSYAAVLVDGADTVERVGGLVGEFDGSSAAGHAIEQCYTSEAQYGARYVGGLVGSFKGGTIGDCYAAGAVLADDHGGGLIGRIAGSGVQIVRSEAYGRVTKDDGYTLDRTYSRGFAGVSDYTAAFTSCRYLKQAGYNDDPTFETGLPSGIVPLEYEDLRVTPANNANDSHPYLMVNAIIFPFEMNTYYATSDTAKESPLVLDHYGDWPAEQSVQPSLVYYERYPDGYYGYYTVTSLASDLSHSNQWLLNTLRNGDGVYCVEDGYALLSVYHLTEYTYKLNDGTATNVQVGQNPALFEQMRVLPFDYTDENGNVLYDGDEPENERFELVYLYQLPFELQETGTNTQLYDKLEVTGAHALGNGSLNVIPGYIFYYSPRFAMTAVNPTIEQSPVIALAESGTPKATALGTASGEGFTTRNVNELSLAVRDRTARQGMALNITGKNRAAGDFEPASFVMTVGGHPDYIQAAYPDAQGLYLYSGSGSYYPMTAGVKGTYTSAPIEPGIVYTIYWKDSQGAYHQIYNMNRDQIGEVPTLQAGQTLYTGFNYVKLYKDAGVNQLFINGEEVEAERKYYFLHGFAHQPLGADGENNYPNQSIIRVTCTVKKGFMWHEWTWAEEGDGTLHDSWGHVREFSINVENGGWALKASTGSMDPTSVEYPNNNLNTLHVRSARQLNALGRYDYTWDWGCEIEAFTQDIDIDFAHYTTTYCGHTLDLTPAAQSEEDNAFANVPIGNDSKLFQKRYDGGGHKIIDYCQLNRDSDNVGLFGRVHGNTLTGIVLYASDPSAETPTAYVKSTNTTTLHPVSDANDAYDYAPDGQPYMTFRQSGCALSVYWWDSHPEDINNELTRNAYLDFLKNQGVDRIYLDLGNRPLTDASVRAALHPFVAAANDRGIEIMPMYSEADPLMLSLAGARTTINNLIAGYQAYKTDYPHDNLNGYHFDVLPHHEGGGNNINSLTFSKLNHYANNFVRAAQAMRAAGITIEINVNCTWVSSGVGGDRVTYEDDTTHEVTTGIYNIVAKYTDRICTMPYADTAEGILTLMHDVLQAMDIYHTPLILGFETGHYPQWNSGDAEFAQESKEYMYTALARVYARLLEDYDNIDGIAMHQHRTWQDMLSRRTMTLETAVPNVGALVGEVCDVNNVSNSMAITKGATYKMYLSDAPSGSVPAHSTYWGGLDIWTAPLQGAAQLNMKVTYSYSDIGKEPPSKVTMNLYKGSSATPSLSVETTSFNGASTAFNRGLSLPINDIRIEFVQTGGDEHAVTVTVTLSASTPTVIKNCCASGYQVIRESSAVYNVTTNLPDIRIQPNVGGLIGYNLGTVDNCYAASRQVVIDEPNTYVYRSLGGLIGRNGGEVTDSYAGGELKYNAVSGSQGTLTNAQIGGVVGRGEGKAASVKSCYSTCTVADQPYYHKAGVGGADHDEPVVYALADTTGNKVRKG